MKINLESWRNAFDVVFRPVSKFVLAPAVLFVQLAFLNLFPAAVLPV